jgi:hypothetical protein
MTEGLFVKVQQPASPLHHMSDGDNKACGSRIEKQGWHLACPLERLAPVIPLAQTGGTLCSTLPRSSAVKNFCG